jgi:hypothetical protein
MASMQHKAFSVLEFSKTSSVIMVQRAFRRRYGIDPPPAKNIRRWYGMVCSTVNFQNDEKKLLSLLRAGVTEKPTVDNVPSETHSL